MAKPTPSYTSDDDNDDASASWGSFRFSPLPSPSLPPPLKALVISALYSAAPPRLNTASLSVPQHNYDRPFGEHVDDRADSRADSEGSEDNFGWDGGKCGGEQGHTFTRDELRRYIEDGGSTLTHSYNPGDDFSLNSTPTITTSTSNSSTAKSYASTQPTINHPRPLKAYTSVATSRKVLMERETALRNRYINEAKAKFENYVEKITTMLEASKDLALAELSKQQKNLTSNLETYRSSKIADFDQALEEHNKQYEAEIQGMTASVLAAMNKRREGEVKASKKTLEIMFEKVETEKKEREKKVEENFRKRMKKIEDTFVRQYAECARRVEKYTKIERNKFYTQVKAERKNIGMKCPSPSDKWIKFGSVPEEGQLTPNEEWVGMLGLGGPVVFPIQDESDSPHPAVQRIDRVTRVKKELSPGWILEIHNEGILKRTKKRVPGDYNEDFLARIERSSDTFFPWCNKTRKFLYSVICGVIPKSDAHERPPLGTTRGRYSTNKPRDPVPPHIKCLILDMRTSLTTASFQRSVARNRLVSVQVDKEVQGELLNAEKAKEAAAKSQKKLERLQQAERKALDISKQMMHRLKLHKRYEEQHRQKCSSVTKPSKEQLKQLKQFEERTKITQAELDQATKDSANAKVATAEGKATSKVDSKLIAKAESVLKKARRHAENNINAIAGGITLRTNRGSKDAEEKLTINRITDVLRVILRAVDAREPTQDLGAFNKKFEHLPPNSSVKNIRQNIQHLQSKRRTNILLRPEMSLVVEDLLRFVEENPGMGGSPESLRRTGSGDGTRSWPRTKEIDPRLVAEQKVLLHLHPSIERFGNLDDVPSTDKLVSWANPGWLVDTRVDADRVRRQHNFSSSVSTHAMGIECVRNLEKPLDCIAQASGIDSNIHEGEGDQWRLFPGDVFGKALLDSDSNELGKNYTFVQKKIKKKPSTPRVKREKDGKQGGGAKKKIKKRVDEAGGMTNNSMASAYEEARGYSEDMNPWLTADPNAGVGMGMGVSAEGEGGEGGEVAKMMMTPESEQFDEVLDFFNFEDLASDVLF
ncbi:hypothetical protein TrLO_g14793 [Triparma laevis f. longispina]|uniref:Uncharacterized protein n=1 Tax=Triparma laevis f. longispina TaxID=1714387 RepID=A0A9W7FR83_9STRA|nr:hypothetical protein TrLO_g14793 [Triparma laevis f. longispina]